jgi:hypothetical protein
MPNKGQPANDLSLSQHPLNYAFALALKRARQQEGETSESISRSLGIGWSLYRLIESGSAVLQPDKAIALIRAFQKTRIEFRPLSALLVALQILAANKPKTVDDAQRQLEDVAAIDEGLEQVVRALDSVWGDFSEVSTSREVSSLLEEAGLTDVLLGYLAQDIQPNSNNHISVNQPWADKLIVGTPPLFLDLAGNVINDLKHYSPLLTIDFMRSWEDRHRGKFRTMTAVCESLGKVIKTFGDFDWSFLADVNFRNLQLISLTDRASQEDEKSQFNDFWELVKNKDWFKNRKNKKVKEDQLLRISFVTNESLLKEFRRLLIERVTGSKCDSAWVYELGERDTDTYYVVIMDNRAPSERASNKVYSCVHCSWEQTESWVKLLKRYEQGAQ